ncbi:modulator of macroautophagy TMEM150B-B-like [Cetorhinus maximus]
MAARSQLVSSVTVPARSPEPAQRGNNSGLCIRLQISIRSGETVNQIHVHLIGAFLTFFIGNLYFWLQVALTYKIQPRHGGKWIGPVRIICCLVCTVCLILLVLLHNLKRRTAAAICEWIAGMVLLLLFGLFAVDFRHINGQYFHVMLDKTRIQNSTTTLEL